MLKFLEKKELGTISLLLLSAGVFFYYQPYYIPRNFSLFLGVLFAPFIFKQVDAIPSNRFLWPTLGLGLLLFFVKTNSLFYGFWVCFMGYAWESRRGRLNNLPVFLFLILSFLSQQILNNWSFPIRLKMSALAGEVISLLGYPIEVVGNMIYLDGNPFSVDPACMGLKMMVTGQLLALVIFAYFEKKNKQIFSVCKIGIGLLVIMSLTILANFSRLVALVLFQILPDNPMHDIIGLISLGVYALLPFYLGLYFLQRKSIPVIPKSIKTSFQKPFIWTIILFFLFLYQGYTSKQPLPSFDQPYPTNHFVGFKESKTKNGILKLENEQTLVYIKPPVSFFQGSHDPRVCWQGSGYEFKNIKVENIGNTSVYTALLMHQEEQFYTAWWYDNLETQTIEEWQWRLNGLQTSKGYFLVNVSSMDKTVLLEQVGKLLR